MKNSKATKKGSIAVKVLAAVVLLGLLAAAAVVVVRRNSGEDPARQPQITATAPLETEQPEKTPSPTEAPVESDEPETDMHALDGVELGSGLVIEGVNRYAGMFVEDGSDEIVADVFAITVKNTGDSMLQYASIAVGVQGASYSFNVTSLPAGGSVQVLESGRREIPGDLTGAVAELTAYTEFSETPSMHENALKIETGDFSINVTNVSGEDITGDIYVYYKTVAGDMYMGGITYRAKIEGGLAAGASGECYAGHFTEKYSEILFVTYVK